jgi:hypothetical protein
MAAAREKAAEDLRKAQEAARRLAELAKKKPQAVAA